MASLAVSKAPRVINEKSNCVRRVGIISGSCLFECVSCSLTEARTWALTSGQFVSRRKRSLKTPPGGGKGCPQTQNAGLALPRENWQNLRGGKRQSWIQTISTSQSPVSNYILSDHPAEKQGGGSKGVGWPCRVAQAPLYFWPTAPARKLQEATVSERNCPSSNFYQIHKCHNFSRI